MSIFPIRNCAVSVNVGVFSLSWLHSITVGGKMLISSPDPSRLTVPLTLPELIFVLCLYITVKIGNIHFAVF